MLIWLPAKRRSWYGWYGVGGNFGRVCLSVCLLDDNFRKPW